jgi:hypothetical protein
MRALGAGQLLGDVEDPVRGLREVHEHFFLLVLQDQGDEVLFEEDVPVVLQMVKCHVPGVLDLQPHPVLVAEDEALERRVVRDLVGPPDGVVAP